MKPKQDYTRFIKADTAAKNYFAVINLLIAAKEQFKIAHWQTTSFAQHKALDGLYSDLNDLLDTLVEVSMGKYGRFTIDQSNVALKNLGDISLEALAKDTAAFLINDFPTYFAPTDTELLNIRDEFLAALNKFLYLLTLE